MAKTRIKKTITQHIDVDIDENIELDIDDVYDGMNEHEKAMMLDYLVDEMDSKKLKEFIEEISEEELTVFEFSRHDTFQDIKLADALIKIFNSRIKLSNSQLDNIIYFSENI